uniref:Uncharacterized protein n=1 Tax=Romanomermis culicivorax TaxID=13658 RepID=A0A915JS65_ROMCU
MDGCTIQLGGAPIVHPGGAPIVGLAAFGSQVPAIVIKKKRKKKSKLKIEENEQAVEKSKKDNDNCTTTKESSPEDFSLATESLNDAISIHFSHRSGPPGMVGHIVWSATWYGRPHGTVGHVTTDDEGADLDSSHAYECHEEQSQKQQQAIRTGSASEFQSETSANGNYFPADLDLIQTAGKCAILTGSWPDLSQPQKDSLTSALSPMHSDFYGAYYENRQIAFNSQSNGTLCRAELSS